MKEVNENKKILVTKQVDVPLQTLTVTEKYIPFCYRLLELQVTLCLNERTDI